MLDFDLNRALFLTYVGVGAAFVVLGTLIVYTWLVGSWGTWRRRRPDAVRSEAPEPAAAAAVSCQQPEQAPFADPQIAAAIAAAVALALEDEQRERLAAARQQTEVPASDGDGWRGQGRMVAFDYHRLRDR